MMWPFSYLRMQQEYLYPVDGIPAYLYKYAPSQRVINMLLTNKIYFSHRRGLNDPFDGKAVMDLQFPEKTRKILAEANEKMAGIEKRVSTDHVLLQGDHRKKYQKKLLEDPQFAENIARKFADFYDRWNIGMFCMTEKNDSFPMWAHYAEQHSGCCIRFNFRGLHINYKWDKYFPFVLPTKVLYSNKYPVFPDAANKPPHQPGSIYTTKSKDWEYESEWRAIMYDGKAISPITGISIPAEMARAMHGAGAYSLNDGLIDGIILGCKMTESDKESVVATARMRELKIYQAAPKLYKYGMEIKAL